MVADDVPLIELSGITRTFGTDGLSGVHGVDLRVWPGEFVAITGPSGSGKSTLLNVLGLLDRPTGGTYRLNGQEVSSLPEKSLDRIRSEQFGFVFQSSYVLGDSTALENAALALRVQAHPLAERARRALRALDLLGVAGRVNMQAGLLSGGERQRVAIARAIAHSPQIVFADEPTGNLDSTNSRIVVEYLRELTRAGVTVVLITHDPDIAARADRVVELVDGEVNSGQARQVPVQAGAKSHRQQPRHKRRATTSLADDAADAVSAIGNRLARTTLLVAAFTLGIAGLVMSVGVGESAAAQVSGRLSAAALDEVRVQLPGGAQLLDADDDRLERWITAASDLPHVENVSYIASVGPTAAGIRRLSPLEPRPDVELLVISASPSYFGANERSTISLSDSVVISRGAWLGKEAAAALGVAEPGPGSTIWAGNQRLDVLGILTEAQNGSSVARTVVVTPDVVARMSSASVALLIKTADGFPASVADAVPLALDAANPGQFTTETVADLRALQFGVSNDLGLLLGALSAILLALATLSASTTMYLSVQSRSAEIALRRAIGSSRSSIARMFIIEGLIIGIIGGAVGAAAGTAGAMLAAYSQGWASVLPPALTPTALTAGAVAGVLSAVIPSVSAARKDPARLLRSV